jgi:hypothetical protein
MAINSLLAVCNLSGKVVQKTAATRRRCVGLRVAAEKWMYYLYFDAI